MKYPRNPYSRYLHPLQSTQLDQESRASDVAVSASASYNVFLSVGGKSMNVRRTSHNYHTHSYTAKMEFRGLRNSYRPGFRQNTDPRSTDPYKIKGKMKMKKAQKHQWDTIQVPETSKMADALQISDSCSPFTL